MQGCMRKVFCSSIPSFSNSSMARMNWGSSTEYPRQRNARIEFKIPGRNLVNVEPETIWKPHNLWRNGRYRVVIVLSQEAKIDFGKGIDLGNATHFENASTSANQCRMIGLVAHQLQAKISFHRSTDVRRPTLVDRPATVFVLVTKNLNSCLGHLAGIARAQQGMHQDVIGFQCGIGF